MTAVFRLWKRPRIFFCCLVISAGILLAGPPPTSGDITVRVFNWAHVDPEMLSAAEGEASRIFRGARVGVTWLNCSPSTSRPDQAPICAQPCPWGQFVLRTVSDVPPGFEKAWLGVAFNETGIYASIFYNRVDEVAKEGIATHSQILGHTMAHELGHLLLDLRGHSHFGIMRERWNTQDLRSAAMGALLFTPTERALIRRSVMRRMRSESSRPGSIQAMLAAAHDSQGISKNFGLPSKRHLLKVKSAAPVVPNRERWFSKISNWLK